MAISTIGTDALAASAVTSTKLASGVPSRSQLPAGTVLQVVSQNLTSSGAASGGSWQNIFSASITPTSSTSKILITAMCSVGWNGGVGELEMGLRILRNGSVFVQGDALGSCTRSIAWTQLKNSPYCQTSIPITVLDSPATTSSITYMLQGYGSESQSFYYNRSSDTGGEYDGATISTITLMEIAA